MGHIYLMRVGRLGLCDELILYGSGGIACCGIGALAGCQNEKWTVMPPLVVELG